MLIASIIVLVYTFAGGLFSSAYTDIFQIYLAIGAFWAAFIFFAAGAAGVDFSVILGNAPPGYLDLSGLTDMGNGALVNWAAILALGLGDIVALDFMERVFAAKDGKTASRGAYWGAGLTLLTIIPTSMMGIIALYYLPNLEDPFTAYPTLAIDHMPFPIGVALLMGVLGASMSTANGGLLAISSVISRNIIQRNIMRRVLKREGMGDKKLLMTTRIFTIPMMAAAFILGYLLPQPGIYLVLAFDIVFAGDFGTTDARAFLAQGQHACCDSITHNRLIPPTADVLCNSSRICRPGYLDTSTHCLCNIYRRCTSYTKEISRRTETWRPGLCAAGRRCRQGRRS